jgi:type II secretory pathway predicted ATPase ExeA
MYLEHYGLCAKPFSLIPDPAFLYLSAQHSIAYHTLEYGLLEQAGITVISGEVGAGKTTLLRYLLDQHREDELVVGLMANTQEDTGKQLMKWISLAFNLPHGGGKVRLLQDFQHFMINNYAAGKTTVLIIDEAQNLTLKALEELRLLNNINSYEDELFKIVLVGQPELLDTLTRPELSQFAQRVTLEFHLHGLGVMDTVRYIQHRLKVAGATSEIFDKAAMYAIFYVAGGVPRLVNSLCDFTLLYGFSHGKTRLDVEDILEVVKDRRIGVVNKAAEDSKERTIARDYIKSTRGLDIAEVAVAPGFVGAVL